MHVGIILDGNRRYAKTIGKMPWDGHKAGAKKVKKLILEWAPKLGIKELTLYAFSMQNFKRDEKEISFLMKLFKDLIKEFTDSEIVNKKQVKVKFIGRINLFPKEIYKMMLDVMEKTKDNKDLIVNLAMGYGGREEIVDAVKKVAEKVKNGQLSIDKIDQKTFSEHLYINHDPDFIIRTGGEHRSSNFLAWQSTYSEWFYPKKFWPEFEKEDLKEFIEQFSQRNRRFGK